MEDFNEKKSVINIMEPMCHTNNVEANAYHADVPNIVQQLKQVRRHSF